MTIAAFDNCKLDDLRVGLMVRPLIGYALPEYLRISIS
jgi:hypothetical protein